MRERQSGGKKKAQYDLQHYVYIPLYQASKHESRQASLLFIVSQNIYKWSKQQMNIRACCQKGALEIVGLLLLFIIFSTPAQNSSTLLTVIF